MVKNENKIISNVQVVEENIQIITPSTIRGNFYPYTYKSNRMSLSLSVCSEGSL